uniref:Uncharacterized protein n=1 Tax=Siphoviridae sp. ctv0N24 TaxID=2826509 RepID=A0A8S5N378_9CAUD|nr:MAG TPA: hypothetical protein [Siphoviridae sp. ctv0N24]
MPKVTEAQKRATAKYEQKNYDRILTRFPKGTKEKILSTGAKSVNSFIIKAVLNALGEPEAPTEAPKPVLEAPKPSKPGLLPLTPENVRKIDYRLFIDDWNYQFKIIELFGEDAAYKLRSMSESEFKKLANSGKP